MLPTKIVVIGAGSASFGLNTLGALMRSPRLRGSELALVDQNADTLANVHRLAERLNREWDSHMSLSSFTQPEEALPGAKFVVSAIEVPPREKLWRSDFEIPLKYGVRQPYAENGGPGGFAHAARNIGPVLAIAHAMEKACPDAWFINFTNPMVRIVDAIARYSAIRPIGLCHQIYAGYGMIGVLLADYLGIELPPGPYSTFADPRYSTTMHIISRRAARLLDIKAAGTNHFTWMLDIRDMRTGEDLYPLVRERWDKADPSFEPLTHRVYDAFGWMPIPGDSHLCEYLPWTNDPATRPWEKYNLSLYDWERAEKSRGEGHRRMARMGSGQESVEALKAADSEGAVEMIEAIAGGTNHYHLAVDLPNDGYITNLPAGSIVETPGLISGFGARGFAMGALPEPVAQLVRAELARVRFSVDAAALGDRQAALQCLLLDPDISDLDTARAILDDYLTSYRQYLPQFWQ